MIRTIPLLYRRIAVVAQLGCYPVFLLLARIFDMSSDMTNVLAMLGVIASSAYLYYKTGLWQFGNAPDEQVDERQIQIRNQAYRFAYMGLSTLALLFVIYLTLAHDFRWIVPTGNLLVWSVMTFVLVLPSAILAWTETDV